MFSKYGIFHFAFAELRINSLYAESTVWSRVTAVSSIAVSFIYFSFFNRELYITIIDLSYIIINSHHVLENSGERQVKIQVGKLNHAVTFSRSRLLIKIIKNGSKTRITVKKIKKIISVTRYDLVHALSA